MENCLTRARLRDVAWECESLGEWPKGIGKEAESEGWQAAYEYAVRWAMDEDFTIDEEHILALYHRLTQSTDGYRTENSYVLDEDHPLPEHGEIPVLMEGFFAHMEEISETADQVEWAAIAHMEFVAIHPLANHNGRVARLMMNAILLHGGHKAVFLTGEWRGAYNRALTAYVVDGDRVPFLSLIQEKAREADGL